VSSDLRVAVKTARSPAQVLAFVNAVMLEREQPEVFVTGVFLTLELDTGRVVLANAGHCPPLVRRAGGSFVRADPPATAMGFFHDTTFTEAELALAPGDAIILYTDGLIEALSSSGEEFGAPRLELSRAEPATDAAGLAANVIADLRGHMLDAQQVDDMTLIVCRYR
jgi:sigma-B regulation protein RsbU (phosphoserine phosphatase)